MRLLLKLPKNRDSHLLLSILRSSLTASQIYKKNKIVKVGFSKPIFCPFFAIFSPFLPIFCHFSQKSTKNSKKSQKNVKNINFSQKHEKNLFFSSKKAPKNIEKPLILFTFFLPFLNLFFPPKTKHEKPQKFS